MKYLLTSYEPLGSALKNQISPYKNITSPKKVIITDFMN